jgi:circadian clock protein KaiC
MLETSPPKVPTGIPGLDDVLAGGLPRGRLYLVEGDPGTGKTTLGPQFLLEGARRGETTLYVTLTETADELRAVAQFHGWSLGEIGLCDIRPNGEQDNAEADYTILHPGEMELGEIMKSIGEQVKQIRPARLVLDSVTEMRLLARDALRHRRQVLYLKRLFDDLQCTVLVLDDRSSQHGDLQLQSISHGALRLEHIAGDYGVGHRRLRVLKLRGVAYRDGFHDFRIVTGGIIVFPRLVAAEHETTFKPGQVPSSIPELDAMLSGGFDRGTAALIMGPAGSGKSILATQYAVGAAQRGERAAIYLFEEGVQTFLARAAGLAMNPHEFIKRNLNGSWRGSERSNGRTRRRFTENSAVSVFVARPVARSPRRLAPAMVKNCGDRRLRVLDDEGGTRWAHSDQRPSQRAGPRRVVGDRQRQAVLGRVGSARSRRQQRRTRHDARQGRSR